MWSTPAFSHYIPAALALFLPLKHVMLAPDSGPWACGSWCLGCSSHRSSQGYLFQALVWTSSTERPHPITWLKQQHMPFSPSSLSCLPGKTHSVRNSYAHSSHVCHLPPQQNARLMRTDFILSTSQPPAHRIIRNPVKVPDENFWAVKMLTHPGKRMNIWLWNRKGQKQTVREKGKSNTDLKKREKRRNRTSRILYRPGLDQIFFLTKGNSWLVWPLSVSSLIRVSQPRTE